MRHFTKQDYTVSQWSGGTTTQIAIYPPDARYADRDFLWRISSATVDLEESDFTPLGDYQRWITVLDGTMTLTHDDGSPIELTSGHVHPFDGDSQTRSVGRCTDFNLMLRKGRCSGTLRALPLSSAGSQTISLEKACSAGSSHSMILLFCCSGGGRVHCSHTAIDLVPYESVLLEDTAQADITLTADQDSLFIAAEMHF